MINHRIHIVLSLIGLVCAPITYAQTVVNDTIETTLCISKDGNILQTERVQLSDNQELIWTKEQNGVVDTLAEDGWRIFVNETKKATYTCQLIEVEVNPKNNLMANGDFEKIEGKIGTNTPVPSTFSSSYKFAGWDPQQYYADGKPRPAGDNNLYAITHDATYFWKDFATVKPHGGKYLALFDAGESGDAWRASTKENTALVLEKDSVYLFSYWAAHPNIPQYSNSPAIFQFVIKCKNSANKDYVEYKLGEEYKLDNTHNNWVYQEVRWKAPMSADSVIISVHDCNDNAGDGNDFCLDDIMFQKTSYIKTIVVRTYIFHLEECNDPPCDDPVVHTKQDTAVYEKDLPIEWHGIVFEKAKQDTIDVYDETTGCLTDRYIYELTIKPMGPPCIELMYAKWDDVIFVPNTDSLYVAYQWYHDGVAIEGAVKQFYYLPEGLSGSYYCVMQTRDGDMVETCPEDFENLDRSAEKNPGNAPKKLVAKRTYPVGAHLQIVVSVYDDNTITAEKYWK